MKHNVLVRRKTTYRRLSTTVSVVAMAAALAVGMASPVFAVAPQSARQQEFAAAAQEFGVPLSLLLAVSYNESHWQSNVGMSSDGGYGLLDLRAYQPTVVSGRDGSIVATPKRAASYYTLDQAAAELHLPKATTETNEQQNIRGGAAVLAQEARALHGGQLPAAIGDWYDAVAEFGGATSASEASTFADSTFATLQSGLTLTTPDDQMLTLAATPNVQPNKAGLNALGLPTMPPKAGVSQPAECPTTLTCRFIPAAYAQDDPNDPTNYGNYDSANRPSDMHIRYIFIHDGEGTYDSIISHFQDPLAYDSAQYVISSKGDITQMVTNEDVSWGVGNWNMNMHGINIEHEGFAAQGASWYTPAMYQASATLVRWLASKYHIPLDRQHILGHDDIMRGPAAKQASQHWDPGPYWDWNYYMDLLHGKSPAAAADTAPASNASRHIRSGSVVTIAPRFATNQPVITDCQSGTCTTLPKQGANFIYLHTTANAASPLLRDQYLHTDGSAGTAQDDDWGDKAQSGTAYVVAATKGAWVGVWYDGQIGWFLNPPGKGQVAFPAFGPKIAPRSGLSSISVYTNAYPEASVYPSPIPMQPQGNAYTLPAGQSYTADFPSIGSDYYYDATANYSLPDDHMIVVGKQRYYEIRFNHHVGFVKVEDVTLQP